MALIALWALPLTTKVFLKNDSNYRGPEQVRTMTAKERELIKRCLAFPKDPVYWGRKLIVKYLQKLKERDSDIPTQAEPDEIREKIVNWVKKCDKDLSIFYEFHFNFERERKKAMELLSLDGSSDENQQILTKIKEMIVDIEEVEYDPFAVGSREAPKIVYLNRREDKVEVWFAVKMTKPLQKTIRAGDLSPGAKEEIQELLRDSASDANELKDILCRYSSFQRIINTISFDLDRGQIQITTDEPKLIDPDDDEAQTIKPENRFSEILDAGFNALNVDIPAGQINEIRENKRINKQTARNIRALEEKDMLIVPSGVEFDYESGDISEKNKNRFYRYTTQNLKNPVSSYYEANGTFKGFFKENQDLNAEENGRVLQEVKAIPKIKRTSSNFFIFLINKNGEIVSGRVICNLLEGHLKLILEPGSQSYQQVHERLDKIFS